LSQGKPKPGKFVETFLRVSLFSQAQKTIEIPLCFPVKEEEMQESKIFSRIAFSLTPDHLPKSPPKKKLTG
jgi:hypothetical protein